MPTGLTYAEVPILLRPAEAARLLGVSRAKVYGLIGQGILPGVVRVTGSIRISRAALERWIVTESERS